MKTHKLNPEEKKRNHELWDSVHFHINDHYIFELPILKLNFHFSDYFTATSILLSPNVTFEYIASFIISNQFTTQIIPHHHATNIPIFTNQFNEHANSLLTPTKTLDKTSQYKH